MITVNEATKTAYKSDSVAKNWTISFPELSLTFTDDVIIQESAELFESVMEGDDLQFIGCIASRFSITLRINNETADKLYGALITVSISTPTIAESESVTIFTGYVDEVELESNKRNKKITAYDSIYKMSQIDVATWYKTLPYPITLKQFRDSLFTYIRIPQADMELPCDGFTISRMYSPEQVSALEILKQICQINCVFGRMGRTGTFEYAYSTGGQYDSAYYYRSADYQEYEVKKINKLTIRFGEIEGSYTSGYGDNEYVIQNNIFMTGQSQEILESVARVVFPFIQDFSYIPFNMEMNGLPYLQCTDKIVAPIMDVNTEIWEDKTFIVLTRTMTGMQAIKDTVEASGNESIHQFVSDLQINMEKLEKVVEQLLDDIDNLKLRYYLITNNDDIDIADGDKDDIIDLWFTATQKTVTILQIEVLCEVETTVDGIDYTDAVVNAIYELNGVELTDYYPTQTWMDGKHILHLFKSFVIEDSTLMNHLYVYLEINGGAVHVDTGSMRAILYGQNLVADEDWDGRLDIKENAPAFNITEVSMQSANEVVSASGLTPTKLQPTQTASVFNINELTMISPSEDVEEEIQ